MKGKRTLAIKIPAGVETGSRLRLSGKGEGGTRGGTAGDLYVVLHVKAHDLFQRRDEDIFVEMPIPMHIAALGGEVEVPTIHGYTTLKIPAGTENGTVFRLRDKGVVGIHGGRNGDQHVRVIIEVADRLSRQQKEHLRNFGESCTESNHPRSRNLRAKAEEFYQHKEALEKK